VERVIILASYKITKAHATNDSSIGIRKHDDPLKQVEAQKESVQLSATQRIESMFRHEEPGAKKDVIAIEAERKAKWVSQMIFGEMQIATIDRRPVDLTFIQEKFRSAGVEISENDAKHVLHSLNNIKRFESYVNTILSMGTMGLVASISVHTSAGLLGLLGGAGILAVGIGTVAVMTRYRHLQKEATRTMEGILKNEYARQTTQSLAPAATAGRNRVELVNALTSVFYDDKNDERKFVIRTMERYGVKNAEIYVDEAIEDIVKMREKLSRDPFVDKLIEGATVGAVAVAFIASGWTASILGGGLFFGSIFASYTFLMTKNWGYRDLDRVVSEALSDEGPIIIKPSSA
jgi:hypothetical protein